MPKIPTYTSQGRPTAEAPGIKTTIQAPMQTSLTGIGSAIAKYYVAEKKQEAKIKSSEYENESWNELYNIYDKHKNSSYPTDATNNFLQDAESYKQNFLNTRLANESKFTKNAWLQKFENNKSSTLLALNKSARNNLEKKNDEQFDTFASSMSTRLRLDSSFAAKVDLEIENEISKIEDPFVREKKRKSLVNVKDATILDVTARQNPIGLLEQLQKNPELYSNIPEEKEKAIIYSQNIIKKMNEESFSQTISQVVSNIPFGQQADTLSLLDTPIKNFFPNPKDQSKAMRLAEASYNKKISTITKDGAGEYFINNDPRINQLYKESLTNPNDFKTFVQILDKKFDEQKIPDNYRTYLPNEKITEIKTLLEGTPGATERINIIDQLKNLYGDKMPLINKQIDKQIDTGISMAISTNSKTLRSLSVLGSVNDEEKKYIASRTGKSTEIDLLTKIEKNFSPLSDVIANQPEGYKEYSSYVEKNVTALKNAAMNGILQNKYSSVSEAADSLSKEFLNDYIVSQDTFYIPFDVNGKIVNTDFIEAKAKVFETKLYFNNIDLKDFNVDPIGRGGVALSKEETVNQFKKNGEWYMDGNTGIKFGIKESFGGFTPMKVNGKNVTINFLDYDGEFSSMKDVNGNSFIMDMKDIYRFINAEFEGEQVP
jgi:hypothetical protein